MFDENLGPLDLISVLRTAVQDVVNSDTSVDPDNWNPTNPFYGHCAVVSLIVQNIFGGELLRGISPDIEYSHYWNKLPSGQEVDLTIDQFPFPVNFTEVTTRERHQVLTSPTRARYELLSNRVKKMLMELHGEFIQ